VEAAIAIVGAVRTKTLLILVPRRIREVRVAHVAKALGEVDEVNDLGRVGAARNGNADPAHPVRFPVAPLPD
jgi:hypothetical protein